MPKPGTVVFGIGREERYDHVDPQPGYVHVIDRASRTVRHIPWHRVREVTRPLEDTDR